MAVVTPDCRVIDTENLYCADISIFSRIPNGNLNAPTIMVAERAADQIAGNTPLQASDAPVWIDPSWREAQRTAEPQRSPDPHSASQH